MTSYRERYLIRAADRRQAEEWTDPAARRLGLIYYMQKNVIGIYSSRDFGGDLHTLTFCFSSLDRENVYLRRIAFDSVKWLAKETATEPPVSLEELIEKASFERGLPPEARPFAEMYEGIYARLFARVEHGDLHTDLGGYEE